MATKQDYYELLGISRSATPEEIKKAYRTAVKKYHPDNNPDDKAAEEKFKEINEANTVLSDPEKKARYDQIGHSAYNQSGGGSAGGYGGFNDFDFSDLVRGMMGGFGGGQRRRGPSPGNHVEANITVDFMDSINGATRDIEVSIKDTCDTCKGSGAKPGTVPESCRACNGSGTVRQAMQTLLGYMETTTACKVCRGAGKIIRDKCATCNGAGKSPKRRTIVVKVPKGIESGQSIRFSGQGEAGDIGAPKGDLYVRINVAPHKDFKRRGQNLYLEKNITFAQAALGAQIEIETPYGTERHNIVAGTQTGTSMNLRGKGVPYINQPNRTGDLTVTLNIVVPKNLNDKQKELLRQFAEEDGDNMDNLENKKGFFKRKK
ncbi:MAG: molecular chaperone DnaJ [Defluviitaleaceae bacterium]|nr:molecular chaperone DnaJ [Defluviitaleaceae bacterium]